MIKLVYWFFKIFIQYKKGYRKIRIDFYEGKGGYMVGCVSQEVLQKIISANKSNIKYEN